MAVTLALISALTYGVSDFLGGIFSRRASAWQISVCGQSSAAVVTWVAALLLAGDPTRDDLLLGALAGVGSGFGIVFLYRGLAHGRMGVVAPVSAVGSALVPLAVGLAQGDRPSALAVFGVVCAFPAIWLVARPPEESDGPLTDDDAATPSSSGLVDGVLAGLGFGLLFAALGQVPDSAGFVPLAIANSTAILAVITVAVTLREAWVPRTRAAARGLLLGPLSFIASGTFLLATHHGLLSIVSVIAALYPASTVLLAWLVLSERIGRGQAVGLGAAAVAVSLVALG
ncbi:EamA family transporter [Aeromicrobium sp. Leaf350]|uniref:EamA family transporter n=1 Tax=Aeromicrobium sp. Leaf350 TaxID=2876565 RepID=UPI001E30CB98|nr:EamA family transporter [Aeromicrobium sp. Leaf350]